MGETELRYDMAENIVQRQSVMISLESYAEYEFLTLADTYDCTAILSPHGISYGSGPSKYVQKVP